MKEISLMPEFVFGSTKCQRYYISLCSKLINKEGKGVKNPQNPVNVVYEWTHTPIGILRYFEYFRSYFSIMTFLRTEY